MSGDYPTRGEFLSALRADERALEEAKSHVAKMAPIWRQKRQQPFEEWKAERQRRAKRLFAELHGEEAEAFPPPAVHYKK